MNNYLRENNNDKGKMSRDNYDGLQLKAACIAGGICNYRSFSMVTFTIGFKPSTGHREHQGRII